jgi:threonine dehydrogenase-like Zn-dependent dehydrogenase
MSTLLFERSLPRFAAARVVSSFGSGRGAGVGPLRLVERDAPIVPAEGWVHVEPVLSGICGSDLATLDGRSSLYFEDIVSFPFVPGHEVVGTLSGDAAGAEGEVLPAGSRVVLQPVLGCAARGIEPACPACQSGHVGNCGYIAFGHIRPGLQTGFCADTGGGWSSTGLVAHSSQLYAVPDALTDEDAVTVEPVACAVHAVSGAPIAAGDVVAVIGAGTLGLLVTAALSNLSAQGRCAMPDAVLVGARYAHQQRLARELGATEALLSDQLGRAVRRYSRSLSYGGASGVTATLSGGADVVLDCVGSPESIEQALDIVRPRGTVVLVGMPGKVTVDLAPLWHREVRLAGAYAYGTERRTGTDVIRADDSRTDDSRTDDSRTDDTRTGDGVSTFSLAFDVAAAHKTGRLVSATYPLARFEDAVAHAGAAGRRGAVKIAFDVRKGPIR